MGGILRHINNRSWRSCSTCLVWSIWSKHLCRSSQLRGSDNLCCPSHYSLCSSNNLCCPSHLCSSSQLCGSNHLCRASHLHSSSQLCGSNHLCRPGHLCSSSQLCCFNNRCSRLWRYVCISNTHCFDTCCSNNRALSSLVTLAV